MNILAKSGAIITACVIVFMSCHTSKKSTGTETAAATSQTITTPPATVTIAAAPTLTTSAVRNGIIPGELELQAIQLKYPDATAQTLSNGHELYIGKCTDCHRKKNIFAFSENKWKEIIADMAPRSHLTPKETDDLYKYVLSMKATQNAYAK